MELELYQLILVYLLIVAVIAFLFHRFVEHEYALHMGLAVGLLVVMGLWFSWGQYHVVKSA